MGGRASKQRKAAAIEMSEPVDILISHPTEVFGNNWIIATLSINEGEISAYDKYKKLVTVQLHRCSILSIKKDNEYSELFLIMDDYQIKIRTKNKQQFKLWLTNVNQSITSITESQNGIELQDLTTQTDVPSPSTFLFPILNIAILVVGTRGDIQPFIYFAQRLQQDGHRIRLATHTEYRPDVMKAGLEYYPLGGDPRKLSEFMVKSEGKLLPTFNTVADIPEKTKMVRDILFSCYPACTQPDPEDPLHRPFYADAIISNPVTYGHIHCAQAMNIPLHIMFPQPWSPTKSFPHPLSNMGFKKKWSRRNHSSFVYVDGLMWVGLGSIINEFRVSIGLNPMGHTDYPGNSLLNAWKVPISHMYSPAFVPKCKDWPSHVDVVGEFRPLVNTSPGSKLSSPQFTPPPQLLEFFLHQ